jgi:hypothetical protein
MESLTASQSIFVVFFAIFWGAIFNVQSRWRMFQPILRFRHIRRRLLLSILVVNVAPIVFFVWAFYSLKGGSSGVPPAQWGLSETFRVLLAGVLPAFAIFGFYRLWMGIAELLPQAFYESASQQRNDLKGIDPTIEELHLDHPHKWWNLLFAVVYFIIAFVGLSIG